jgi:hypothetical protein
MKNKVEENIKKWQTRTAHKNDTLSTQKSITNFFRPNSQEVLNTIQSQHTPFINHNEPNIMNMADSLASQNYNNTSGIEIQCEKYTHIQMDDAYSQAEIVAPQSTIETNVINPSTLHECKIERDSLKDSMRKQFNEQIFERSRTPINTNQHEEKQKTQ